MVAEDEVNGEEEAGTGSAAQDSGSGAAVGIFLFDTSHHALWAEEVARELGVPVEVVPAPPETGAKCDLALRTLEASVQRLVASYREEGIAFRLYV
jgi:hypothetical protein